MVTNKLTVLAAVLTAALAVYSASISIGRGYKAGAAVTVNSRVRYR